MTSYPGLITRDSVSLDEDDLTDVEDEVFIRDGRSNYKLAEDRGLKRPLMAPRRKPTKSDLTARLKNKPSFRVFCVPCCYALAALTIFLGLIVLVIILFAIFPLPFDTLKSWITPKTNENPPTKIIPCTDLEVSEVWSVNLPKLASESPIRSLDVNLDGVPDIIFGYGLGEDVTLPQQWFCPMFLNVNAPCEGGIQALDGATGAPLWQRRLPYPVFNLFCCHDVNADNSSDCLASGKGGVLTMINARNGDVIWNVESNTTLPVFDVYSAIFTPDLNGDSVPDVIAAHTVQINGRKNGSLLIFCGKTGKELSRVSAPNASEILSGPQLFRQKNDSKIGIIFGTGSEDSEGSLYLTNLSDIYSKNMSFQKIYTDKSHGILNPIVFADLNSDGQEDLITVMYGSATIIAFDGETLALLWNYTDDGAHALSAPIPGYFNGDSIPDFLIKVQVGAEFPEFHYSKTIIIDGKLGKPIYNDPLIETIATESNGLSISVENYGNDLFLFWMADCLNYEGQKDSFQFDKNSNIWQKSKADLCKFRFNSSMTVKLYGLSQYNEPPGIIIYNSENQTEMEYNNTKLPLDEFKDFLENNPDFEFSFRNKHVLDLEEPSIKNYKYNNINSLSNFRHRDDNQGLLKDFSRNHPQPEDYYQPQESWDPQDQTEEMIDPPIGQIDYDDSFTDSLNIKPSNIRDIRSKADATKTTKPPEQKILKKDLSSTDSFGPNDYKNIFSSRHRLLHDLNNLPSEILRENYLKNRKKFFRDSKFEQRDLRIRENEENDENSTETTSLPSFPESLWDLESEKEIEDRENGYWRGKRNSEQSLVRGIYRISSTGILLKPLLDKSVRNSIDLVFLSYWIYPKKGAYIITDKDEECIRQKMLQSSSNDKLSKLDKATKEDLYMKQCLKNRGVLELRPQRPNSPNDPPFANQIAQLSLGQMTVYRLQLKCKCPLLKSGERCAQILQDKQSWGEFLGGFGNGTFQPR